MYLLSYLKLKAGAYNFTKNQKHNKYLLNRSMTIDPKSWLFFPYIFTLHVALVAVVFVVTNDVA